jgi:hypothetical protein
VLRTFARRAAVAAVPLITLPVIMLAAAPSGGGLLMGTATASATTASATPVPPFSQCPPVGLDTSCAVLIVLGPGGSKATFVDPTQPPFDGIEDTLIGVQNNSGAPVSSLSLTGSGIFALDGDGLCSPFNFPNPAPAGCPYGTTGYEGRATSLPVASTAPTTFPAESYSITDANTGTVHFLNPPIPDGGSAYFSLEGPTSAIAPCTSSTPATVTLSPTTAVNPVSTSHTVTATVNSVCGTPVGGVTVHFTIASTAPGQGVITGTCTTDASGTCSFTYQGPILPGQDAITGCAGPSGAPPCGAATKTWVLPVSSCKGDITNGGWMIDNAGNRVNFGGVAHADLPPAAPSGEEEFQDQPKNINFHSMSILAITCNANLTMADIYGIGTENGEGAHPYRIEVTDPDSTGGADTYWLFTDNYNSGSHKLGGGTVEIHAS